jgi:cytochrome c oxidase assembly factor CtaG
MTVAPGLVPLDPARMLLTAWTPQPAVMLACLGLAGAYLVGVRPVRRAGGPWPRRRTACHLAGVALLAVVGLRFPR